MTENYLSPISGISKTKIQEALLKATATEADVLSGKTFYAGDKVIKTGALDLGAKVSTIEISAAPVGNEYREGDSSYNTGRQILWCKTGTFGVYGDNYWNTITVTSYSNGIIYYHWRVHNNGARAYVPVIFS